jgi:hypothetical protein
LIFIPAAIAAGIFSFTDKTDHTEKRLGFPQKNFTPIMLVLIRMFTNFGSEVVFSADLCYNGITEKPPSEREVARVA